MYSNSNTTFLRTNHILWGGGGDRNYQDYPSNEAARDSFVVESPGLDVDMRGSLMQKSASSHSVETSYYVDGLSSYHFGSVYQEFLDLESDSSVRRVFSAGDLQQGHRAESPISSESNMIIESMKRASKYSPEEKKERIERYRNKRSQRNFNKKIKYECRKTLADSRPRIRGRFTRNDEIDKNPQLQWSNMSGEEDEDDNETWVNSFLDPFLANSLL